MLLDALALLALSATPSPANGDGYQVIHPRSASASASVRSFAPAAAFDGDPKTAWVASGAPEGAYLEWSLPKLGGLSKLRVRVLGGDRASAEATRSSGAPSKVLLEARSAEGKVLASAAAKLNVKGEGPDLVLPISSGAEAPDHLRLTLEKVRPGAAYSGAWISEIETAALASEPLPATSAMTLERPSLAASTSGAKLEVVQEAPLIEEGYNDDGEPRRGFRGLDQQIRSGKLSAKAKQVIDPELLEELRGLDALVKGGPKGFSPEPLLPEFVRGLPALSETLKKMNFAGSAWLPAFLEAGDVAYLGGVRGGWVDPRKLLEKVGAPRPEGMLGRAETWGIGPVYVAWADAEHTRPERVFIREHWETDEGRAAWVAHYDYVLRYDEGGHLAEVLSRSSDDGALHYAKLSIRRGPGEVQRIDLVRAGFDTASNSFSRSAATMSDQVARRE